MIALVPPGVVELTAWRLDRKGHSATWDSGEGARRVGGRWNSRGRRAVYCSLDPSTTILELAVHSGFPHLDIVPHVLTKLAILKSVDLARVHVVVPSDIPNPNWLRPAMPSAGQQAFGDDLLAAHAFILLPSVITNYSWNLIFDPAAASGLYSTVGQEDFGLDTRLDPPSP